MLCTFTRAKLTLLRHTAAVLKVLLHQEEQQRGSLYAHVHVVKLTERQTLRTERCAVRVVQREQLLRILMHPRAHESQQLQLHRHWEAPLQQRDSDGHERVHEQVGMVRCSQFRRLFLGKERQRVGEHKANLLGQCRLAGLFVGRRSGETPLKRSGRAQRTAKGVFPAPTPSTRGRTIRAQDIIRRESRRAGSRTERGGPRRRGSPSGSSTTETCCSSSRSRRSCGRA